MGNMGGSGIAVYGYHFLAHAILLLLYCFCIHYTDVKPAALLLCVKTPLSRQPQYTPQTDPSEGPGQNSADFVA
jgi:hypothetical protein